MKTRALMSLALAGGLVFASNTFAAGPEKARATADRAAFTLDAGHMDTKHLIGMKVVTPDGKHAGEIDHLIVGVKDGKISHAIIGLGGVAGVGERQVVVPWSQVKIRASAKDPADRKDMVATVDRAVLDSARRYTDADRDRGPAASPATAPAGDRDGDGVRNRQDRAPDNSKKQ